MLPKALTFLKIRIEEAIGGRRNALEFAKKSGGVFSYKTLQNWIDGKTWPDAAQMIDLARLSNKPLSFFQFSAEAPEPTPFDLVEVPVLDLDAAAGAGTDFSDVKKIDAFTLPRQSIEKIGGSPRDVACLRAKGDSMAPTILDGALMIIDRRQTILSPHHAPDAPKKRKKRLANDDLYVFYQRYNGVRIKRLRSVADGIIILCDNPDNEPEFLTDQKRSDIRVLGRVIWWDNRL